MIDDNPVFFLIWSYCTWVKKIIRARREYKREARAQCGQ